MTVDIKCPHCGKETDYDLNYNEGYCEHCEKEMSFGEMYVGHTIKNKLKFQDLCISSLALLNGSLKDIFTNHNNALNARFIGLEDFNEYVLDNCLSYIRSEINNMNYFKHYRLIREHKRVFKIFKKMYKELVV